MEPSLLFETSVAFEGATDEDRIRQSIIDVTLDPPGPEEASGLMSQLITYISSRTVSNPVLLDIMTLVFQCFETYPIALLPIFNSFWKQRQDSLAFFVCTVGALSGLMQSEVSAKLPEDSGAMMQQVLDACKETPMKPLGFEIPKEMEKPFLCLVMLGADLTKEIIERFWMSVACKEVHPMMQEKLTWRVVHMNLGEWIPDFFGRRHSISDLPRKLQMELLEQMSVESLKQIMGWWVSHIGGLKDGDLAKTFMLKCAHSGVKVKRRNLSYLASSLKPEHFTDEIWSILLKQVVALTPEILDKFPELPKPEIVLALFSECQDRLDQKVVDEVLEKTTDCRQLEAMLCGQVQSDVLRTAEFWIKFVNGWSLSRPPRPHACSPFRQFVGDNWDVIKQVIFSNFPPAENQCKLMTLLFFDHMGPGTRAFGKEKSMEIMSALTFEGDCVNMPSNSFWGLCCDHDALFELIMTSKYSAVFMEEYAFQMAAGSIHKSRISDFDLKEQTKESLAEVAKYAKDTKGDWFVSDCSISLAALSFIVHAHLYYAVCKEKDEEGKRIMNEKVISKLTPQTFLYFVAVLCRGFKLTRGLGQRSMANLDEFDVSLWSQALEFAINDTEVQSIVRVCVEHWNRTTYLGSSANLNRAVFAGLVKLLTSGKYVEDSKALVYYLVWILGARSNRDLDCDEIDELFRWLVANPDSWPNDRTTDVIIQNARVNRLFKEMAEKEETVEMMIRCCWYFSIDVMHLNIENPTPLLKYLSDSRAKKDLTIMSECVSLLFAPGVKGALVQWIKGGASQDGNGTPTKALGVDFFLPLFKSFDMNEWKKMAMGMSKQQAPLDSMPDPMAVSLLMEAIRGPELARYFLQFSLEHGEERIARRKDTFCRLVVRASHEYDPDGGVLAREVYSMYTLLQLREDTGFIVKPVMDKLPPLPELGVAIVNGLMTSEEVTPTTFFWLIKFASFFPYFITDVKGAVLLASEYVKKIPIDLIGGQVSPEAMDDLTLGVYALTCLHFLLLMPAGLDAFIPWFFENIETFTNMQVFLYLLVLNVRYQLRGVQHVMTAVFMKYSLPEVSTKILSRDFENTDMRGALADQVFQTSVTFYYSLYNFDVVACVTADEIGKSETPFQDAFRTWHLPMQVMPRLLGPRPPFKLPEELVEFVITWNEAAYDFAWIRNDELNTMSLVEHEVQEVANAAPGLQPYEGPLPEGISPNAFKQLPRYMQCHMLNDTLSKKCPATITESARVLVHQPEWVAAWFWNTRRGRPVLTPEHYAYLYPVVEEMAKIESQTEERIDVDDFTLPFYCQSDYVVAILDYLVSPQITGYCPNSLCSLLQELSKKTSLFAILEHINVLLSRELDSANLDRLLAVLNVFPPTDSFKENFGDICAAGVLDKVCQCEYRSDYELLGRAASLLLPFAANLPNRVVHLITFLLGSTGHHDLGVALDLLSAVGPVRREYVMPYVQIAFDLALENDSDTVVLFLEKAPEVTGARHQQLIAALRRLLSNPGRATTNRIGMIFSALAPVGEHSHSFRMSDSMSIDVSTPTPIRALPLPLAVIQQAPEFWDLFAEYRKTINQMIRDAPSLLQGSFKFLMQYPELIDFPVRVSRFHNKMQSRIHGPPINISVRRESILIDSYNRLKFVKEDALMSYIHVRFLNEEGVDAGGVRRDWFTSLTKELFNQNYALFTATAGGRSHQPNPASYVNQEHVSYFKFAGRVIARALVEGVNLDAHLTTAFCKHILQLPLALRDLETVDEDLHRSLKWLLDNEFSPEDLDIRFTVDNEYMGRHEVIDLKPNGSNILVTNQNKREYVQLVVEHRLKKQIRAQVDAFCSGFHSVIPPEDIRSFTPNELDLLICGVPEINVADMRQHCIYIHPYTAHHPVVETFFAVISKWDNEALAKLLLFMTGSSQVPIEGFKYFVDIGQPIALAPGGEKGRLPVAHTCMNTLDLPEYTDVEELDAKLSFAIYNCDSFGII